MLENEKFNDDIKVPVSAFLTFNDMKGSSIAQEIFEESKP